MSCISMCCISTGLYLYVVYLYVTIRGECFVDRVKDALRYEAGVAMGGGGSRTLCVLEDSLLIITPAPPQLNKP